MCRPQSFSTSHMRMVDSLQRETNSKSSKLPGTTGNGTGQMRTFSATRSSFRRQKCRTPKKFDTLGSRIRQRLFSTWPVYPRLLSEPTIGPAKPKASDHTDPQGEAIIRAIQIEFCETASTRSADSFHWLLSRADERSKRLHRRDQDRHSNLAANLWAVPGARRRHR